MTGDNLGNCPLCRRTYSLEYLINWNRKAHKIEEIIEELKNVPPCYYCFKQFKNGEIAHIIHKNLLRKNRVKFDNNLNANEFLMNG